MHCKQLGLQ